MTRVVSALILGGLVVYLVLAAPAVAGHAAIALLVLLATAEMARLMAGTGRTIPASLAVAGPLLIIFGVWTGGAYGLSAALAAALALMAFGRVLTGKVEGVVTEFSAGALLLLVPAWSLAHASLYLASERGRSLLMFLLVVIWACDSAAYYVGSTLGRRKLAPAVSPNKTVEGFAAGLVSAVPVAVIFNLLAPGTLNLGTAIITALGIALFGQAGDLVESAVKRDAGVKDSGGLIPGHGGVLDRADSLLFTVPLFYYLFRWLGAA